MFAAASDMLAFGFRYHCWSTTVLVRRASRTSNYAGLRVGCTKTSTFESPTI